MLFGLICFSIKKNLKITISPLGNAYVLYGKNLSSPTSSCSPARANPTDICGWSQPKWLSEYPHGPANLTSDDRGIQVTENGLFYVFADYYFHSNGSSCAYDLIVGNETRECLVDFDWTPTASASSSSSLTTRSIPSLSRVPRYRKCSLGFVTRLSKRQEVKLTLNQRECYMTEASLNKVQKRAVLGVIKIA